ncbi:hypothetical protein ACKLNO_05850 [Neisseriaceae bacterium B1]
MQGRFMVSTDTKNHAGIDIAKRNFVIGTSSLSKTKTETSNEKGFVHTIEYLNKHKVQLVVLESTGGLEVPLTKAIHRSSSPIRVKHISLLNRNH